MDDSDKPNALLAQIPLMKSPFYNPPKPIHPPLVSNIPLQITKTIQTTASQIEEWIAQTASLGDTYIAANESHVRHFQDWKSSTELKIAPGLFGNSDGVLTPIKAKDTKELRKFEEPKDDLDDVDRAFGKASLN